MSFPAEQSVIGGMMLDATAWHRVAAILTANDFTDARHKRMFELIGSLVDQGLAVDPVSVMEHSERQGNREDAAYAIECANNTPGASNIESWAGVVRDHAISRQLRRIGQQIAMSDLVGALAIEEASRLLASVQRRQRAESVALTEVLVGVYKRMCERDDGVVMPATPAPLAALNRKLGGGWGHGHLIIVAGRPGSGKTAFARDCALAAANHGAVSIISLEMGREELGGMMLAKAANISYQAIRDPSLLGGDWSKITAGLAQLRLPIHVCDQSALSLPAITSEARRIHSKHKLSLLCIDYLGLVDLPQAERNDIAVGTVTRGLKALAKELGIPVMLLCQLSRKVEDRQNKRPILSDLRDAGQIEQDADVVVMLYRDKYYNEDSEYGDIAEINFAKQRHGAPGVVPSIFRGEQMTFAEYEGDWPIHTQPRRQVKGFQP